MRQTNKQTGFTLIELLVIVGIVAIVATIGFSILGKMSRSEGTRAGILQKFSKKGLVIPTHEGELALPSFGRDTGTWEFSVNDQKVASQLESLVGRPVKIHYKQKIIGFPNNTSYDAISVEADTVEMQPAPAPAVVPLK